jgi:hypothetical protein
MKKRIGLAAVGTVIALLLLLVVMTAVVSPDTTAPAVHDAFNEYFTFWSGDLRIFSLTGDTVITIYDLDTNLPLDFSDPRIDSTNFGTNPFVLENQGDAFEGVGGLGPPDQEIRVRIVSSDALDGGADRPILVWTGSLADNLRHPEGTPEEPPQPPETDNPWMSYIFGVPEEDSDVIFSRKLGRAFLGFTSREMYIFARVEVTPTEIVINDLVTNTDSDDDDSQTLGPADVLYADDEIEVYYLDQFEDDTVTVTGNVDLSVLVGISSREEDDWTVTPPSYGIGDDGFKKGTLFYTFARTHLTVFPLQDDTTVTITDLCDGPGGDGCPTVSGTDEPANDDSNTITLEFGDTNGDYDFYTPVLESDQPTNGPMIPRPALPAVRVFSNEENGFENDFVKVEADKPILVYVGPVASDFNEFADFSFTTEPNGGKRINYVYAQNSGDSNDLQVFGFEPTQMVTITSLTLTDNFWPARAGYHDFVIGPGIGECEPFNTDLQQSWCEGTADGGVWWGSQVWTGEVLRIESSLPVIVLNGDYDNPNFGTFVPYFARRASVEIVKEVSGIDDDDTSFDFTFNGEPFSLKNGESQLFDRLLPDSYTISELVPQNWLLAEISCDNGIVLPNPDPAEVTLDVDLGQDIVCTFTNEFISAVDLVSFTADAGPDSVTLKWQTASEMDTEGFNIWRSEAQAGPYTQLNASLIPAQGNSISGASYEFTDEDVVRGATYFYKLQDVDTGGATTFSQPVPATPGANWRIYIPIVFGSVIVSGVTLAQRKQSQS